jgi:septum site-determining protein MinC
MGVNKITSESRPAARLKGVGDSLWVVIDPQLPLDTLKDELTQMFSRLNYLTISMPVVLDTGKNGEHESLIKNLGEFLKEKFNVGEVSSSPNNRSDTEKRVRTRDMERSWKNYRSDVLMMAGRVRSGQMITAKKHLILLGDVNPGGQVSAGGDILIMGSLAGTASAGQEGNESAIILALDFKPTQVQIAGIVAAGASAVSTKFPEYAYVENGQIVVENYLSANPFARMPWPKIR